MLFGARQTGKSTLLRRTSTEDTLTFNLQERRIRLELERNPASFTQTLEAHRHYPLSVHVDEVQKVPPILDEVQYLVDRYPGRFRFVLTGSSSRKFKTASANLLPGRAHRYQLCPVTQLERIGHQAGRVFPLTMLTSDAPGFPSVQLNDVLLHGNLPGIAHEPPASRARTLESYVELYLEEEIRREALVRNVGAFHQFLELAALESGSIINLHNLSRESGVPVSTLRTYYQILEDTFIAYRVSAYGINGRKRVLTTPRIILFDNGVRNAAARLRTDHELLKTQMGVLLENWVGQELMHRCLYAGRSYRVSFWRTAHGAEVDYVLETPDEVIPIAVKATDSPQPSDARHLKLFLETYPEKARRGFVICRCQAPRRLTEQIEAVPWHML